MAMQVLIACMRDTTNSELVALSLDALCCVIGESDEMKESDEQDELGERFAEIFMKSEENVGLAHYYYAKNLFNVQVHHALTLLGEYEFAIRRSCIHFITGLMRHCQRQMQDALLADPTNISHVMDLLVETREVLRNDVRLCCSLSFVS